MNDMETYKTDIPKRFCVGDPLYYEQFKGEKLNNLVVDINPPSYFTSRVVLFEDQEETDPEFAARAMIVYLAPEKTIETYMKNMMYESQDLKTKPIGVDTARYRIEVDGRADIVYTGGDGWWGNCDILSRNISGRPIIDSYTVVLNMPEFENMDSMRDRMMQLFKGCELTENVIGEEEAIDLIFGEQAM